MGDWYILDGKRPVREPDMLKAAYWFGTADRNVALTDTQIHSVSTVFLGYDHNHFGRVPILFETMVFERYGDDDRLDDPKRSEMKGRVSHWLESLDIMRRYPTWADAEIGHQKTVAEVLRAEMDANNQLFATIRKLAE
ncbi:hypothetical protein Cp1R7AA1_043 [Mesorhizobium phage Cp1R7A-A1]|nr:hypothetical protein Cp1R7AA1_043 [Mesorhizobium phage Cp1R7A-A1]